MSWYAPPVHAHHRPHVDLRLGAIIGLAAALIALGSWVLVDRYTGGGGATQDATTLIDEMDAAVSAGDEASLSSFFTKNAVLTPDDGSAPIVGSEAIGRLASMATANDFRVERVAPVTVAGDFATTFMRYASATGNSTLVSVFQFKEGKILRQWIFSFGRTPPFDNAVMS